MTGTVRRLCPDRISGPCDCGSLCQFALLCFPTPELCRAAKESEPLHLTFASMRVASYQGGLWHVNSPPKQLYGFIFSTFIESNLCRASAFWLATCYCSGNSLCVLRDANMLSIKHFLAWKEEEPNCTDAKTSVIRQTSGLISSLAELCTLLFIYFFYFPSLD